jgi:archaeal type IV pilus assembly protein PilA
MNSRMKTRDSAVSPVVGVMLMLVVTIIIAAVVSAFAGGMGKTTDKAPTASLEVKIANDGTWGGSYIDIGVKGVSDAIPTKDLKITTSWKSGSGVSGGATTIGPNATPNVHVIYPNSYHAPLGFGPGVNGQWVSSGSYGVNQYYGNYSLVAGTRMHNSAYGGMSAAAGGYGASPSTRYYYTTGTSYSQNTDVDGMEAILGKGWNATRPGDVVTLRIVHTPSGKPIFDGKVTVEG